MKSKQNSSDFFLFSYPNYLKMKETQLFQISILFTMLFIFISCVKEITVNSSEHDLKFDQLAQEWDEGIPLGYGILGNLVWQKNDHLRMSLDCVYLWDLRPTDNMDSSIFNFNWVYQNWKNNQYEKVQKAFDEPYERDPGPTKIPAGAIEFPIKTLGEIDEVHLSIQDAACEVLWTNGTQFISFMDESNQVGWFKWDNLKGNMNPIFIPPGYFSDTLQKDSKRIGLQRLEYEKGTLNQEKNEILYTQKGWNGFEYQVYIKWIHDGDQLIGCWSITSSISHHKSNKTGRELVNQALKKGFYKSYKAHQREWTSFWNESQITIPDKTLEKQWYLEQYKFKSTASKVGPPISLQAIWTADNGSLPPWKGDFHHDLNTQLSYWPAYSGNHLNLSAGFTQWLWNHQEDFKSYTKHYFGVNGLNMPGVSTINGSPMGGWIQYALGPTVSAWMSQHFYWQWKYSKDSTFLKERAYPWIKETAIYLKEFSVLGKDGKRKLPLSSSPEINNNSRNAWFDQMTNFDLALVKYTFLKAAELAQIIGYEEESRNWMAILNEFPDFSVDDSGFMIAPNLSYNGSHRHFSHLMAIYPLGILNFDNPQDRLLMQKSVQNLEKNGTSEWVGYSFCWMACLESRIKNGDAAANYLKIFAQNFCLPNSFHVNGEQFNRGFSNHKYKPFTLEGNFAFAAALQEMLLQSYSGVVTVFPAIPKSWKNLSFYQLRAENGFLISAEMKNGKVTKIRIQSEAGGVIRIENPFITKFIVNKPFKMDKKVLIINTTPKEVIVLKMQE